MNLRELLILKGVMGSGGGGTLVENTVTGNPVAFTTRVAQPLTSFEVPIMYSQSGSGDPSQANIRPISGVNSISLLHTGKNLLYLRGYSAANKMYNDESSLSNNYGTTINTTSPESSVVVTQANASSGVIKDSYENGYISIRTDNLAYGVNYDVSCKITNIVNNPLNASLSDMTIIGESSSRMTASAVIDNVVIWRNVPFIKAANMRQNFELRVCGMSLTVSEFMVTPANTSDGVYKPYSGIKSEIPLTDTCYGGTYNIATGKLTLNYVGRTLKPSQCDSATNYGNIMWYEFRNVFNEPVLNNNTQKCSVAIYNWNGQTKISDHFYVYNASSSVYGVRLMLYLTGEVDESQDFTVIAPLETPKVIQIDPREIITKIGDNTILTNATGSNTIVYLDKQ